jgi:YrbI family 3-deoxy-D-manno-octulosonate 8-phosphate phosphatase
MIIGFIPLRGGSKSIPNKNIKNLGNQPLCFWIINAMQQSKYIDRIVVATDSDSIENVVKNFNFPKVEIYRRSHENAKDDSSTESVILEYLNTISYNINDIFILAQATSPLTASTNFDEAIIKYTDNKYDSLLSCVKFKRFIWNDNGIPLNYDFLQRPRRQDFNGVMLENGAFYINRIGNILKFNNRLSGNVGIYEMSDETSIEIDEPNDWYILENYFSRLNKQPNNKKLNIKLFVSDVDGVMTDSGMYYSENGDELKKFNTRDGKGFELLKKNGIKTAVITSENTKIVENRCKKLKIDFLYQGKHNHGKLDSIISICKELSIDLDNVSYIGDDINCLEAIMNVGLSACPSDAHIEIKNIERCMKLESKGGFGAVREFSDYIIKNNNVNK